MYVSLGSGTIYSDLLLFRRQSFFMNFEVNTIAILRLFLSAQNIMTYLFSNRRVFVAWTLWQVQSPNDVCFALQKCRCRRADSIDFLTLNLESGGAITCLCELCDTRSAFGLHEGKQGWSFLLLGHTCRERAKVYCSQ